MTENKYVDLSYLRGISEGDNTLVIEMIDLFLEKSPEMLNSIEKCCKENLWKQMAEEIHRFKPNLDYMGMADTKKLIEEIEVDANKKQNIDTFEERFEEVKERCLHAYEFLKEERSNLK